MKKFLYVLLILSTVACSSTPKEEPPVETAEILYNQAYNYLEQTKYKKASETFEKVELEYPYSKWATSAKIMSAYSYYLDEKYDDAIISLDRFLKFHPANIEAPYAYYLKAMCYYDQIQNVEKEQGNTKNALLGFQELIARFPNSKYTQDAKKKIILARDNIAGQEMEIGRYYLRQENYLAAVNRFSNVVKLYQTTNFIEEALYRQVEVYTILGLPQEASKSRQVLARNYPESKWSKKANNL
ncbi:MAG: outer membrane protein assembly factor BamD [Alphaproteobacteria bacterium]